MEINVFQFNGCNKCFYETLILKRDNHFNLKLISKTDAWEEKEMDIAIITGYLLPKDKGILEKIRANSKRIIAYGSCPVSGGIFGLANQKGNQVSPIKSLITGINEINGCLADIEELRSEIKGKNQSNDKQLCSVCSRKSKCDFLSEVNRQIEINGEDTCFNDLGFLCSGYIAKECKERCINYGTPCRGCKPIAERAGIRMLSMFGTLMSQLEVATEASAHGGTDKLADKDDEITKNMPDIVGNFFRFSLANSGLPKGKIISNGSMLEEIIKGRLIEEIPLIFGHNGGTKSISLSLDFIEAYEMGAGINVSSITKKYRENLRDLQEKLLEAINREDGERYNLIRSEICKISGNFNLSNVFYGGFKTPIKNGENFEEYKSSIFQIKEGNYENESIKFDLDSEGIIKTIKIKQNEELTK